MSGPLALPNTLLKRPRSREGTRPYRSQKVLGIRKIALHHR
jgi:hypothetical protein